MSQQSQQNKIIKDIETRLKTIMIGSISRIENTFGYLWNHGNEPKTKNQEVFAEKWENLRLSLLNHGNHQIREAVDDLADFFENQKHYSYNYNFVLNNKNRRS
jgi:hypothetical protein